MIAILRWAQNLPLLLASAVVVAAVLPLDGVRAEEWNQEVVTELATELHASVKDLQVIARQAGAVTQGQPRQDRVRVQARDTLRKLQSTTNSLVNALKQGKGKADTMDQMKRARMLATDTAVLVRSAAISPQTQAKLAAAGGLLTELERYYGLAPEKAGEGVSR